MNTYSKRVIAFVWLLTVCFAIPAFSQNNVLTLPQAISIALTHYKSIQAKDYYALASRSQIDVAKSQYLPDVSAGAQAAYGTNNGINGPNYPLAGVNTTSGGVVAPNQNWNATSGSIYALNLNWQFFSFGSQKANVAVAKGQYKSDEAALEQEKFQLKANVCGAYLNLLAAQRFTISMQANLSRATYLRNLIRARTVYGLNPGVDSTIANAALSKARLDLLAAQNNESIQKSQLITFLGQPQDVSKLDTSFVSSRPDTSKNGVALDNHPVLQFLQTKTDVSRLESKYIGSLRWPKFSFFTLLQTRGSGLGPDYVSGNNAGNINDLYGLQPMRSNYVFGISATWNLTDIFRLKKQKNSQDYLTKADQSEYDLEKNTLQEQGRLALQRLEIAGKQYEESPQQLLAATQAFKQKSSLYENGLATIVDVTQALYAVNQAQTDQDLAYNGIWQALLFKAESNGDLNIFFDQINQH
jgi:outer membrane protein TolC